MTSLIELQDGEHRLIGDVIGDSFSDDPVNRWIFGCQQSIQQYYTRAAKKLYLAKGFGHVTKNGNGGSLWLPPGVEKQIPLWNSLDIAASMIRHSGIKSLSRGMAVDEALAKVKPTKHHYYLFAIGARQEHQGKGIGGTLMQAGLKRVDAAHMPAYLESSKESNVGFYQRFGFEVTEVVSPKGDCPPLWAMWREAR